MRPGLPASLARLLPANLGFPQLGRSKPPSRPSYRDGLPAGGPLVSAAALIDVELRSAAASVIALSAAPAAVLRGLGSQHRRAVEFYADLSTHASRDRLFPDPPVVDIQVRPSGRLRWASEVAEVDSLSFKSPHIPVYPGVRERFASHTRNATARAMHWRHADGPRSTIVVVHGFTGSPYRLNSSFFQLPWFYRHGCDVVLALLPFHGARNDWPAPYSGSGLFTNGIDVFTEAMLQSVIDLRALVGHLRDSGVDNVGMTGLSLGGYVTALMASVEPRLHLAIPNCAVTEMASLVDSWFPAGQLLRAGLAVARVDPEAHRAALGLHSPLRFPPVLAPDRLFIVGGQADRLAPPDQSARLWDHWGRPGLHWFPGSHVLHVGRSRYLREIGRFLRSSGFSSG